jgi:hypothetical protein
VTTRAPEHLPPLPRRAGAAHRLQPTLLAAQPPPDPSAWERVSDPCTRLRTALRESHASHRRTEPMISRALAEVGDQPVMAPLPRVLAQSGGGRRGRMAHVRARGTTPAGCVRERALVFNLAVAHPRARTRRRGGDRTHHPTSSHANSAFSTIDKHRRLRITDEQRQRFVTLYMDALDEASLPAEQALPRGGAVTRRIRQEGGSTSQPGLITCVEGRPRGAGRVPPERQRIRAARLAFLEKRELNNRVQIG